MGLRGFSFVLAIMLLGVPQISAGNPALVSADPVLLLGESALEGDAEALWLAGAAQNAILEIQAPRLEVDTIQRSNVVDSSALGQPLYYGSLTESPMAKAVYSNARTFLIEASATGSAAFAFPDEGTVLAGVLARPGHVHPDGYSVATDDASWEPTVGTDEYAPFATPEDAMLVRGADAEYDVSCTPTILLRGLVVRIVHDGGVTLIDGRATSQGIDESGVRATSSTWNDFILRAPQGAQIKLVWPGESYLFSAGLRIATTAGLAFGAVEETTGSIDRYSSLFIDKPTDSQARWSQQSGPETVSWELQSTNAAPPSVTTTSVGLLIGASIITLLTGAFVAWRTWARRASPSSDDTPGDAMTHGMRLYHEHRFKEALAPLKEATQEHANDHELRYALGVCLLRTGHFREAFGHLRPAVRRMPMMLQMLVTSPETEEVRQDRRFESFIREEAQVFKDSEATSHFGYC